MSQDRARDGRGGEMRAKSALGKGVVALSYIRKQDSAGRRRRAEVFCWWGFSHGGWWWFRVKRHLLVAYIRTTLLLCRLSLFLNTSYLQSGDCFSLRRFLCDRV